MDVGPAGAETGGADPAGPLRRLFLGQPRRNALTFMAPSQGTVTGWASRPTAKAGPAADHGVRGGTTETGAGPPPRSPHLFDGLHRRATAAGTF